MWGCSRKNLAAIRGKLFIRIAVRDKDPVLERSQVAHEELKRLNVPHEYDVAHNPEKPYEALGDRAFAFYRKSLGHKVVS